MVDTPRPDPLIRHVVHFSGGVPSYIAAKRVVAKYGRESVLLLFADTMMEDEDLYRFLGQATEKLGVKCWMIADGRTPWQVMFDEKMLGNSAIALCSRILKREFMDRWMDDNFHPMVTTRHVGLTWDERHRFETFAEKVKPWTASAPLCEPPYLTKQQLFDECEADGIRVPRLYKLGFHHNNCGGFCVRSGQAQFRLLLQKFPARYAEHEAKEEALRAIVGDHSIMRDRRGGKSKPLTMKQFRERINCYPLDFDADEWGGCGCAID